MFDINVLLNQYVADTAIFIVKLHNIHWNIVGDEFMKMHKFTEELYNRFFETYDSFAEILKIKGKTVYGSMADYLKVTTIKELGTDDIRIKEGLNYILDDLDMLLKTAQTLRDLSHSEGDISCTLLAEDEVAFIEKQIWFIRSMLK
jgi:starvation-inducible DNA-binding protein